MRVHTFLYATRAEAEAFVQGVDLVNDPALTIHELHLHEGRWRVVLHDHDYPTDEDVCPVCGEGGAHATATQQDC